MTLKEFFYQVRNGALTELEEYETIFEITQGLKPKRVKLLKTSFTKFMKEEKELQDFKEKNCDRFLNNITNDVELEMREMLHSAKVSFPEKQQNASAKGMQQQDFALLAALEDKPITAFMQRPSKKQLQYVNLYRDRTFRMEVLPEMSLTVARNKLKRYERVIPLLTTDEARRRAETEKGVLERKIKETHFRD